MPQHITVVLSNGSTSHFHGDAMYDGDEGILVIDVLEGATAHFNVAEFVVAWITSPMSEDDEAKARAAIRQVEEAGEDGGHGNLL